MSNRFVFRRAVSVSLFALALLVLAACQGLPVTGNEGTPVVTEPPAMETTAPTESMATEAMPTQAVETMAPEESPMATEGSGDMSASAVELQVSQNAELGSFLVDGEGMTLYWFTRDEPGVSNCAGDCLVNWPPLLVDSPDGVSAGEGVDDSLVGTIPFDGQYLVTYDQYPLYYWINDAAPGDTTGQGVGDVWFVVPPDGIDAQGSMDDSSASSGDEMDVELEISESPELGRFLVDGEGMTLYLFTRDEPGVSNCSGDCLVNWPPVLVDSPDSIEVKDGVDPGKVGAIPFEGGKYLVTYEDMPLYYWINDKAPGDTTGQNVGGVWFVVEP